MANEPATPNQPAETSPPAPSAPLPDIAVSPVGEVKAGAEITQPGWIRAVLPGGLTGLPTAGDAQ